MGMREHDGVDLGDWARKPGILLARFTASTLKHPAIEEHGASPDPKDVAGARHFTCGTSELDLHGYLADVRDMSSAISGRPYLSTAMEMLLQLAVREG